MLKGKWCDMSKNIVIYDLKKDDDISGLVSLSKDFFLEYQSHHKEFFLIDDLKDSDIIKYFNGFIDVEERKVFIAVLSGRVIGYIAVYVKAQPSFWEIKKVGDISGLMVHKDYRRKGIASKLLGKAIDFFKEKGVKYYSVFTAVNNHLAIEFYKQSGMEPLHIRMLGEIDNM